jgi:hypothetical protein
VIVSSEIATPQKSEADSTSVNGGVSEHEQLRAMRPAHYSSAALSATRASILVLESVLSDINTKRIIIDNYFNNV